MGTLLLWTTALVALSSPLFGQEVRPGRWWKDPHIVRELQLGRHEQKALDDLYERNRGVLTETRADLEEERARLKRAMSQEPFDERRVKEHLRRVEEKQQKLTQERMRYLIEVRKILGQGRFKTLEDMAYERQNRQAPGNDPPGRTKGRRRR